MNDNFNDQKEKLVSISHEINLLRQQVNYLLRNEKALSLLDLDVLMNRTHAIYDLLCSVGLGNEADEQDLELDPEAIAGLFGIAEESEPEETVGPVEEPIEEPGLPRFARNDDPEPIEEPIVESEEEKIEEPVEETIEEPVAIEPVGMEPEPIEEEAVEPEFDTVFQPVFEPIEMAIEPEEEAVEEPGLPRFARNDDTQPIMEPEPIEEEAIEAEEMFVYDPQEDTTKPEMVAEPEAFVEHVEEAHEPIEEETIEPGLPRFTRKSSNSTLVNDGSEEPEEPVEAIEPVVIGGKTVHFVEEVPENEIPERDRVGGEELPKNNNNLFGLSLFDDEDFEMAPTETLGEKWGQEDNSLAAKLQQNPGSDLKSSIGINDKFLFVNELFGGSMEKYNKSIDNLNDLKTLNGAMIYLNELKIELQWNSSNEAYQRLSELVTRKFE